MTSFFQRKAFTGLALITLLGLGMASCSDDTESSEAEPTNANATSTTSASGDPSEPRTTTQAETETTATDGDPEAASATATLRYNQIQVLGSHNSYHLQPAPDVLQALGVISKDLADSIEYSHVPLEEQLDTYGIRQFELDVYADPDGARFANREALTVLGQDPASGIAELDQPGFKTLHIQDIDFNSTCITLIECLTAIDRWSTSNPDHVPIMVMIEVKDQTIEAMIEDEGVDIGSIDLDFAQPVPTDAAVLDALDDEIRSVISDERLFTPDDLRGDSADLASVITETGWPTLDELNGKILVALVNSGEARDIYRAPSPVLEGRAMFTSADPGDPDAAFVRVDDVIEDRALVDAAVADGYIVRTRADIPTVEARSGDMTRANAAFASGATFVSTDYYAPPPFDPSYQIAVPHGPGAVCNPVTAPADCPTGDLETLP